MNDAPEQLPRSVPIDGRATNPTRSPGAAHISEIARGSTLNLAGAAIFAASTLGLTVLVTRGFSQSVAGAFFAATSLFLILEATTGLGAQNGVVYFIARLRATGGEGSIPALLRRAIVPVLIASSAGAALLLGFANPLAHALVGGGEHGSVSPAAVTDALRVLAAVLPFAALLDTLLGATRGYQDMWPTVAVERVGRSCVQLLGALAAALLGTAALLAPLWAVAYIPCAAVAWFWLRRIRRRSLARGAPPRRVRRTSSPDSQGFWAFTAPRALATSVQIVIQRLDIVLVGIIRGPAVAAVYAAATRFLVVGQLGNSAISMASQPQLSYLFALRDRLGAHAVYQTTTAWLILLTWPLYLLAINYGPAILSIFGPGYRAGSGVMVVLGGTMLLASGCGQVDVVLTSTGRSVLSLANGLIALTVNVAVDLALIPHYGITGAAIGWAAAIAGSNLIPLAQVARIVHIHPFGTGTVRACALTALSFGVIPALVPMALGRGPAASIVALAAGCVLFAGGLWRWRGPLQLSMIPRPRLRHHRWLPGVLPGSHSHPEAT